MSDQFKNYREMDPELRRQLLSKEVDVLTPLAAERRKYLDSIRCPKCGTSPCHNRIDPKRPYTAAEVLPHVFMECPSCHLQFDPDLKIQYNLGTTPQHVQEVSDAFLGGIDTDEIIAAATKSNRR